MENDSRDDEKITYSSGGVSFTETRAESRERFSLIKWLREALKGKESDSDTTTTDVRKVKGKVEDL